MAGSGSVSFKVEGLSQILQRFGRLERDVDTAAGRGLRLCGEDIMSDSQAQVPVDTGVLKASGSVLGPTGNGYGWTVEAGYGGAASAYARPQHEREDYRHTVGKAKYLEDPFMQYVRSGAAQRRIGDEVLKVMR